jgi:DNA-binding FrmR family transcriptional regulator
MTAIRNERHKKALVVRLRRAAGQLRAVEAMIERGEDCERVMQLLTAARRALDKAFFHVLSCAIQEPAGKPGARAADDRLARAASLLGKFG